MSLRDDLWTFCWGMIIGSCLTALLASLGCGEEPRWCKEPICETCLPVKTVVHKTECLHTDIEGCEARYAQLHNEYTYLMKGKCSCKPLCPVCEPLAVATEIEAAPEPAGQLKPPVFAEGRLLPIVEPLWVETAFGTGDLRKGEDCVAWTGGTLRAEEQRSSTKWLARYTADDDEHGGTLCPTGALVYVNPWDYAAVNGKVKP